MNKLVITAAFVLMVLAQWFVPGNMIYVEENVLEKGTMYKFKTQPIDPTDPFRGKYIVLDYEVDSFKSDKKICDYNDELYVSLGVDSLGYAKAVKVGREKPDSGDYVIAECSGYRNKDGLQRFNLPFNTYYMNEDKALEAELAVREVQRDSLPTVCYGVVYVFKDRAVLDDVQIDGVSIKDYVEEP